MSDLEAKADISPHADHVGNDGVASGAQRGFQPPEAIRNLTPEDRQKLEKKLLRKIDLRILPMIVLMYILNYIDRYDASP